MSYFIASRSTINKNDVWRVSLNIKYPTLSEARHAMYFVVNRFSVGVEYSIQDCDHEPSRSIWLKQGPS